MSAFAELGLREDANEGDVKRAYARRLRTVRPDEDADGFQALNAAYKAALVAVRWRAQAAADADEAEAEPVAPPETPPQTPPPVAPERTVVPDPAAEPTRPIDVPDALFEYATAREEGGIAFDFDAFSRDLFAVTADPEADLRGWLDARMAAWPIAMKPTLAPHVLQALDDEDVVVSPKHFETLIAAFGLDDVLSGFDPLAIAQLRKANEFRFTKGEAVARARRLLAPDNRKALDKAVRVGGYPPFVAAMLARLVTGGGAAYRTGLRWVPLLARRVMNLLRYLSAGHVDALSPPMEPRVLAKWQFADRTIGVLNMGHWFGIAFTALVLATMLQGVWERNMQDPFARAQREASSDPEQAVRDYTAFIDLTLQPAYDDTAENVAMAYFTRGLLLSNLGRTDEALRSYKALYDAYASYSIPLVRLQVAKALLGMSSLKLQNEDYRAAIDDARKVTARYSGANDAELGEDGFDLQVAKALNNEAEASNRLGAKAAALVICRSVLDRFRDAKGEEIRLALERTLSIEREVMEGASSPATPSIGSFGAGAPQPLPTVGLPKNPIQ